ncbi:GntR family transcriptional regulator [Myceligenerans salitolerans]|uniref:GntR family transcriptional regulator n=1 Tax=Myceligenerans salitolerans TaxID=1230528 RepID=A0ABS3IDI5_9MICO|nr:GntR family transcriptional regulator [Myceligenerans salitolerans]MBO0611106.1 GntR family transcriptional regulator [Myceligenerans salitolerans]
MSQYSAEHVGGKKLDRVEHILRNDIEAGRLRDGEALPSTRALAEQMGVSVWTINKAMEQLAAEGLVENVSRSRRIVRSGITPHAAPDETRKPHTFLIGGYAGSGKSELARVLSRLTGSAIVDKDTITRPVVERLLEELGQLPYDRESPAYLEHARPHEYEALLSTIQENADVGLGVIGAAPFIREFQDPAWIERVSTRLSAAGIGLTLVWVHCDASTMLTYLKRRGAARDTAKLANWGDYLSGVDLAYRPAAEHVIIDNSATSEPLQAQASRMLTTIHSGAAAG